MPLTPGIVPITAFPNGDNDSLTDSRISDDGTNIRVGLADGPNLFVNPGIGGIYAEAPNEFQAGDRSDTGNRTKLTLDDPAGYIYLGTSKSGGSPGSMDLDARIINIGDWNASGNSTYMSLDDTFRALSQPAPASSPAAMLGNGQISFYLDEATHNLKVAVKYSDGTTKTGEVSLS